MLYLRPEFYRRLSAGGFSPEKMKPVLDDLAKLWDGSRATGREWLAARCGRG